MPSQNRFTLPQDGNSDPIYRAMGFPIYADGRIIDQPTKDLILGSAVNFVHIYDLASPLAVDRMFVGIHIFNPSAAQRIEIVGGAADASGPPFDIVVPPLTFLTFDLMTFGIGARDGSKDIRIDFLRAKLNNSAGILARSTINYGGSGNPSDGEKLLIHDKIYEFSNDQSKDPSSDVIVAIGGTDDITWTNLRDAVNASEQALNALIDTGGNFVTLESNYGGTLGNGIIVADGVPGTGAVISGNLGSVTPGSGGVTPNIHIW